jgi:hypothetical protein
MLLDAKGQPIRRGGFDLSPGAINYAPGDPAAERRVRELRESIDPQPPAQTLFEYVARAMKDRDATLLERIEELDRINRFLVSPPFDEAGCPVGETLR